MQPQWREIPEYEHYQVSDTGLVRTLDGGYLKQQVYNNYLSVRLYKEGAGIWKKVHRLVAQAFVSNVNNHPIVNHLDYNTFNNHAYNLVWVTHRENVEHSKDRMTFNRYMVEGFNTDGESIGVFDSCLVAAKAMGAKNNGSQVAKALKTGERAYNHYWKRATTSESVEPSGSKREGTQ